MKCNFFSFRNFAAVLSIIISFTTADAKMVRGTVIDSVSNTPLCYANIYVKGKNIGTLTDESGHFSIDRPILDTADSLLIKYLGFEPKIFVLHDSAMFNSENIVRMRPLPISLNEVTVSPPLKTKKVVVGKKHKSGLMLSNYSDGSDKYPSPMKGESFGFEVKKDNKRTWLKSVGFYIMPSDNMMSHMKFRINIYDMSEVTGSPSSDFVDVLNEPIFFDYSKDDVFDDKYTYNLPNPILLPQKAMVEIEFLENMNGEILLYKGNFLGKNTWTKTIASNTWDKNPFSTPFFIECVQEK